MVRALTSHQCDLGSIQARYFVWVEVVVGSHLAPFLRVLWFSSLHENQRSKFQFDQKRGPAWKLQSRTKVLTHLSKTNTFYWRPSVISKNVCFVHSLTPLSSFSMLKYASLTLSRGYNIEKGRRDWNVKIGDRKTHVFNETGLFSGECRVSTTFVHDCS